ncbi:MAG: hypothetical protein LBE22_07780 [Azoarcus sp.]|jgi:hypothetical protein|nr:hypothetical protein [Azoarcus sp.]
MIHHFNCAHAMPHIVDPLIFDWDEVSGEITGPSSERILSVFTSGSVSTHPIPSSHALTSTKNKTDLAAVIGWSHQLPPELSGYYPQLEDDEWDGSIRDDAGNVIGHAVF